MEFELHEELGWGLVKTCWKYRNRYFWHDFGMLRGQCHSFWLRWKKGNGQKFNMEKKKWNKKHFYIWIMEFELYEELGWWLVKTYWKCRNWYFWSWGNWFSHENQIETYQQHTQTYQNRPTTYKKPTTNLPKPTNNLSKTYKQRIKQASTLLKPSGFRV